jgi:uncharacterized protein YjiS (DUF1127 family)
MATSIHTSRPAASPSFALRMLVLVRGLSNGLEVRRQRRALAQLDPHLLADVGLTREQALAETLRPVWDVPASWRR